MAFEHKPGQASLFRNDRKEKPQHPDYTGSGVDMSGRTIRLAAWIKQGSRGNKFLSIRMDDPAQRDQPRDNYQRPPQQHAPRGEDDYGAPARDDLPF